jgi:hypothetical protein
VAGPEKKHPEARRHHYVPSCWLAGFTEKGAKDDRLFVTDLSRKKQWQSTPENAGYQKDFYRLKGPGTDPIAVEKFFSRLEGQIAPLLRYIDRERPEKLTNDELQGILHFMAYQFVRAPSFRPLARRVFDTVGKQHLTFALKDRITWNQTMKKLGKDPGTPNTDYEASKALFEKGEWSMDDIPDWYMESGFRSTELLLKRFRERQWRLHTTHHGRLIACDNPVLLHDSSGENRGFRTAALIGYPISRHVCMTGTLSRTPRPEQNLKLFAELNTMTMLSADAQIYSMTPDFLWLDANNKTCDDWTQFQRVKISAL